MFCYSVKLKLESLEGEIQSSRMELDKMTEALKMSESVTLLHRLSSLYRIIIVVLNSECQQGVLFAWLFTLP